MTANAGGRDGYLFRARRAGGALVWDATYDRNNMDEWFNSLTEVNPNFTPTGDIVAVGGRFVQTDMQGWVVRVNGDNGSIAAGLQGSAEYGLGGGPGNDDEFFSVIQLQNPAETGVNGEQNVVIAGYAKIIDATNLGIENFVVKLSGGNPCQPISQVVIGDGVGPIVDRAHTIRELPAAVGANPAFDLIMTGITDANGNSDAHLLSLSPTTLAPTGVVANTYGGAGFDDGWSTFPVYNSNFFGTREGFIVCGLTQSTPVGDPQDMYLIKTDPLGSSGCEMGYNVNPLLIDYDACVQETINDIMISAQQTRQVTLLVGEQHLSVRLP